MRFLCDEMLARLARLLRAAGHDTFLAQGGAQDEDLLKLARDEDRIVLTRDRRLAVRAAPASVLLGGRGVMAEAESLAAALPIDWELAPFSRCVMDNAPLAEAAPDDVARMPRSAQAGPGPFRICPDCGRLYWPGSHVRRMAARLQALGAQIPPQA